MIDEKIFRFFLPYPDQVRRSLLILSKLYQRVPRIKV
ncbi:hypothetical protein Q757_05925 [Oenococcus alcoholitolerans]|uniref:Uncharacterized protein n=1 Tax=Oenococcus alcoholitolerans TaxID=931074 RepID=A0ABR4XQ93_9LACO|nr:hypothetical protein Q757_05925 [Oenococcus alcoholitolerans]